MHVRRPYPLVISTIVRSRKVTFDSPKNYFSIDFNSSNQSERENKGDLIINKENNTSHHEKRIVLTTKNKMKIKNKSDRPNQVTNAQESINTNGRMLET